MRRTTSTSVTNADVAKAEAVAEEAEAKAYKAEMGAPNNWLPLYRPDPLDGGYIYLGDVGIMERGQFHPIFNATNQWRRGRGPDDFQPIAFSPSEDATVRIGSDMIRAFEPYFGGSPVDWSREDSLNPEAHAQGGLDAGRQSKQNPCFSYKFTKTTGGTSYVLLAMADVQESSLKPHRMQEWQRYVNANAKKWAAFIEKVLHPSGSSHKSDSTEKKVKPEDVIFVSGFIKTSRWVIATLHTEGVYTLDIEDTLIGILPALRLGDTPLDDSIYFGQDANPSLLQYFGELLGRREEEPPRKQCLFLQTLKKERPGFWIKMFAAAEPRDPASRDGEDAPPAVLAQELLQHEHLEEEHGDSQLSYRRESGSAEGASRYSEGFVDTYVQPFAPLAMDLEYQIPRMSCASALRASMDPSVIPIPIC